MTATASARPFKSIIDAFEIHLGFIAAAPLYFSDTPDTKLERTSVFQYGGRVAFTFGNELLDLHRLGIGLGYSFAASSASRKASFITPAFIYEIGHPLILQIAIGYNIGIGTEKFAENYSGVYTAATLRYSFRRLMQRSPVGVSVGLHGSFVFATSEIQYSSAFLGAQVELTIHQSKE